MQTPPAFLYAHENMLLYVDCIGNISVWDIKDMKSVYSGISLAPLIDQNISSVIIKEDRQLVAKSGKQSFIYDHNMNTWMILAPTQTTGFSRLPKIEEIEMQLETSVKTGNAKSLLYWAKLYARKLVDENASTKALELVEEFKYLSDKTNKFSVDGLMVGDVQRKQIYNQILPILLKNRSFQRFLTTANDS
jgi:hypothetical protein